MNPLCNFARFFSYLCIILSAFFFTACGQDEPSDDNISNNNGNNSQDGPDNLTDMNDFAFPGHLTIESLDSKFSLSLNLFPNSRAASWSSIGSDYGSWSYDKDSMTLKISISSWFVQIRHYIIPIDDPLSDIPSYEYWEGAYKNLETSVLSDKEMFTVTKKTNLDAQKTYFGTYLDCLIWEDIDNQKIPNNYINSTEFKDNEILGRMLDIYWRKMKIVDPYSENPKIIMYPDAFYATDPFYNGPLDTRTYESHGRWKWKPIKLGDISQGILK